jgi:hypothetical protein
MSVVQKSSCVIVTLSLAEMLAGSNVGIIRRYESWKRHHKPSNGIPDDQFGCGVQVEGALGEIAVAKAIDRYWDMSVNTFKRADIGEKIQVRTRSKHSYDLIIRDNDNPNHVYVLVTGVGPEFYIRGWCYGHEGVKEEYASRYGGYDLAYFVPQSALRPFRLKTDDTTKPTTTD